jgi:uncharacterized membrane protein
LSKVEGRLHETLSRSVPMPFSDQSGTLPNMTQSTELQRLPDGFIHRGINVTRLEAFVDAAFAFAVTLLVISLNSVPTSIPAMIDALKGVPAFASSFIQIMIFWTAHATWSRRFGLDDPASQRLSLVLVFLVLVYVYPLKILFSAFFAWISHDWLPPVAMIGNVGDLKMMFVVYGVAFATLSLCIVALYRKALSSPVTPPLEPAEIARARVEIVSWLYSVALAVASISFALLLPTNVPHWLAGMPGMVSALFGFTKLVTDRFAASVPAVS